jgi:lipoic acid synthetase
MRDVNSMVDSGPDVFAHNIEVSRRMTPKIRDQRCDYDLSLGVLAHAKARHPDRFVKSSIMVGVGETDDEVIETMRDLRTAGVDILTLGQYLRPTPKHAPVERYVTPERFEDYAREGREMGFAFIASGPLVRSSYHAAEGFVEARLRPPDATPYVAAPSDRPLAGAAAIFPLQERPELDRAPLIRPESLVRR